MKKNLLLSSIFAVFLLVAQISIAQVETPRPSPGATLSQTVGLTDFEINYSRPGAKGRTIFGDLVPYGEVWRTGANSSTKIMFDMDITFGGTKVAAGEYAIYTIPGKDEWSVMLYKDLKMGGATDSYKKEDEVLRISVKPRMLNDMVETFTIDWSGFKNDGATLMMSWEKTAIDIPIMVGTDEQVMKNIDNILIKGPDAGTYYAAARYYHENGKDMELALEWMTKAVEMRPEAFWVLHRRAKLLADMGKTKEAIADAEKSLEMAKANEEGDYGYIKNNEELLAQLKGKK